MISDNFNLDVFKIPVLFLVFNRPDTTIEVFEKISQVKPAKLYIACDGPRKDNDEIKQVEQVKKIVANINWPCEVKTLYREKNLGCRNAVSQAITWFFDNEEMGIILEDDCLPSQSFFWFCEDLLHKYKNEERIGMISGNNFFEDEKLKESYFFSYGNIWGWASWKRAWQNYDVKINLWKNQKIKDSIKTFLNNDYIYKNFKTYFDDAYDGKDTWAHQWLFTRISNKQLTINPCKNLVSNIGFGKNATHTKKYNEFSNVKSFEIKFPLIHPLNIKLDTNYVSKKYPKSKIDKLIFFLKNFLN